MKPMEYTDVSVGDLAEVMMSRFWFDIREFTPPWNEPVLFAIYDPEFSLGFGMGEEEDETDITREVIGWISGGEYSLPFEYEDCEILGWMFVPKKPAFIKTRVLELRSAQRSAIAEAEALQQRAEARKGAEQM